MLYVLWEYHVRGAKRRAFERHYAATGTWAKFFRRGRGYRGTTLLQDPDKRDRYLTIDCWESLAAYRRFRRRHERGYSTLDKLFQHLTQQERCLGYFLSVGQLRPR
ncbi:MAG TPA: antibiotic biosynthesis monooxygenase [Candidatus Xenobia bacterium]|nr:antibiotic biosynthesis monooxygenase [Candidatus Xenobia bacterium]